MHEFIIDLGGRGVLISFCSVQDCPGKLSFLRLCKWPRHDQVVICALLSCNMSNTRKSVSSNEGFEKIETHSHIIMHYFIILVTKFSLFCISD